MNTWFVYMIRCTDGSLYTGSTNHVIRRWHQHQKGKGAKFLQAREPKAVVFVEEHPNRSDACKREYEIKQYSKQEKESLFNSSIFIHTTLRRILRARSRLGRDDQSINRL